jgi:hypothetical protein
VPDKFPHQVIAHGMDEMSLFQVAQAVQQISHLQCDSGLPGSRRAGEAHVQVRPGCGQAELLPDPVDQQQRRDLLYLLLHRDETDQFVVQGGEDVVDARGAALVGQGHRGVRLQQLGAALRAALGARLRGWPDTHLRHRPDPRNSRRGRSGLAYSTDLTPRVVAGRAGQHDNRHAGQEDREQQMRQVGPAEREDDGDQGKHDAQLEMLHRDAPHDEASVASA